MLEDLINKGRDESSIEFNNLFSYTCKDCDNTFSSTNKKENNCIYCGSKNISFIKNYDFSNYFIIPFNVKLEEVKKIYKKKVKFNPLIPIRFKKRTTIDSISKVYFPTYLINANYMGKVTYLAGDKNKVVKNKEKLIEFKKYNVLSDINFDYDNILMNAYSKIGEKEFSKVFSFDYNKIQKIDEEYLKKSFIMTPDISEKDISDTIRERVINNSLSIVRKGIKHELKKLENNDTKIKLEDVKQLLVPVYFINLRYRDNNYHFLINGTNKNIYYSFPIGIIETIIFIILMFGIIFGISYFIATIL